MAMLRHKQIILSRNFSDYRNYTKNTVIYPQSDLSKHNNFGKTRGVLVQGQRRMWENLKNDKFKRSVKTYLGIKEKEYNIGQAQSKFQYEGTNDEHRKEVEGYIRALGWTNDMKEAKEHQADTGGANVRTALSKLGFNDLDSLYSTIPKADISQEKSRIAGKIFKESNKGNPPYHGIEYEDYPKSIQKPEPIGYFSEDWSDIENKEEAAMGRKALLRNKKVFEETGLTPEPIGENDDSDWEESAIIYHPGTHCIPQWLNNEFRELKLKLQRHTYSRTHLDVADEYFESKKTPFKFFDVKGRIQAKDYKTQEEEIKPRVLSFKELMQKSEEHISLHYPELEYQMHRDNYENNEHFEPRYMHKDHTQEDFDWGFTEKLQDSIIPQAFYGEMNPREEVKDIIHFSDEVQAVLDIYEPKRKNNMIARIHSMVKNDGFYDHFLDNQITFWGEFLETAPEQLGEENVKPARAKTILPWEYIIAETFRPKEDIRDNDPIADSKGGSTGRGKRKTAFAFAYVYPGTGKITVNGMNMTEYFYDMVSRDRLVRPFKVTDTMCELDAKVHVRGGGIMGKSDAAMLAIGHAVAKQFPALKPFLRKFGILKQDIRIVEQKKTSHYKARKSYPWVKR